MLYTIVFILYIVCFALYVIFSSICIVFMCKVVSNYYVYNFFVGFFATLKTLTYY